MNDAMQQRMEFFESNYEILVEYYLQEGKKIYIGDKNNRKCRFCGKAMPDVTFKNEAHAIPELIGNKVLIAYDECDSCNSNFSKTLEDHLSKFLLPLRTLAQVKGKSGIPSYKHKGGRSRIDIENGVFNVKHHTHDPLMEVNEDQKTIKFRTVRQPYIPRAVYKCFTKVALSIMPEEELGYCRRAIEWISEKNHQNDKWTFGTLLCFETITSGVHPFRFPIVRLLRRKEIRSVDYEVPYLVLFLAFGNFAYQIFVPMCEKDDHINGGQVKMAHHPLPISDDIKHTFKRIELLSSDVLKGEKLDIEMTYERRTQLP